MAKVLLAGESWIMHTIHQKGFDSFTTTSYGEGHQWLFAALRDGGHEVTHLPNHLANAAFPTDARAMAYYDVILLSDIGSNTLLLHPNTFERSLSMPNRLNELREYTAQGGGLVMVGGYLTFQGIEAKAGYSGTAVEEVLPVRIKQHDDRVECPEGVTPRVEMASHPIVDGLSGEWPALLGYNSIEPREEATTIVTVGDDPLVVTRDFGKGRSLAFASDCGPHWAPPPFVEWAGYARLWNQMIEWSVGAR